MPDEATALLLELTPARFVHAWGQRGSSCCPSPGAPGPFLPSLGSAALEIPKEFVFLCPCMRLSPHQQHGEGSPVPSSTHSTWEYPRFQSSSWTKRLLPEAPCEHCKPRGDPQLTEAQQGQSAFPSGRLFSWQTAMAAVPSAQNSSLSVPLLQSRRVLSSL